MCLADALFPKATAFAFLEEVKRLFTEKYSDKERRNAINYAMQNSFVEYLKAKMVSIIQIKNIRITIIVIQKMRKLSDYKAIYRMSPIR